MKRTLKRVITSLSLVTVLAVPISGVVALADSPKDHHCLRFVWGAKAYTEWEGRHYTRVWIEPWGSDSGRKYGENRTKATAYGDAITSTAYSRYGR